MGKTSQKQKEKRLAGRVSLALAAGMFSVVPVAHGMPTLDNVEHGDVKFNGATPNPGDVLASGAPITSGTKNNIINWKDFSVASNEHVAFDQNNYMNIVTGQATSAIDGKLTGGGDIYLINPHGVIFGKSAQVNVGNLYVSTREATDAMKNAFAGDQSATPDVSSVLPALNNGTSLTSEVVSLIDEKGYVAATKVVMEGRNIRFLNANALTTKNGDNAPTAGADGKFTNSIGNEHLAAGSVIFRANALGTTKNTDNYGDGYIHVGNGTSRYTAQYLNNHDATRSSEEDGVVNYSYLIRTVSDLQNINNDLLGNYMLTDDIDISTNPTAMGLSIGRANAKNSFDQPSGTAFHGHFDGMYYTIKNLNSANMKPSSTTTSKPYGNDGTTYYMGLFAYTDGAKIENVGVVNATITTKYGGGVVGFANDTKLRNVWNAGGSNDNKYYIGHAYSQYVGGIVGYAKGDTQLTNVYNTGYVKGGGLVGALRGTSGIRNAYNIGKLAWDDNNTKRYNGIVVSSITGTTINNVYSASKYVGGSTGGIELIGTSIGNNTTTNAKVIVDTKVNADDITLSDWIANAKNTSGTDAGNTTVSSEGGTNDTWRVYEGYSKSLPLLNSFMKAKGTVSTEYTYGSTSVDTFNYNSDNLPHKTYDAKTVLGDSPVYSYLGANADANLITPNNRKNVYTDTSGNATKFALFYSEQQGYDLYGNNFKIEQRNISYDGSGTKNFTKEYDGTTDGTNALKALFSASSTSSDHGFLDADAANVKFELGSGVNATYNSADVLNATTFTISGAEAPGAIILEAAQGAENPDAYKNYKVGTVTNLNGIYTNDQNATVQITPRSIKVSLKENGGITKTYDGTATVTDQNKGETDGFLPNENVVIESGRVLDRDNGVAVTYNNSARYVDVGTNGLTSAVNAGAHKVAYEGIALTGGDATKRANYKLVDSSNAALTAGYILADGTIAKRKITANDLTSPTGGGPTKTYDGTSTGTASTTVGVDESMLVDAPDGQGGTLNPHSTTNITGLLFADKELVKLTTTGDVAFGYVDAQGFHASADATTSGYTTAANKARYTVALDTANSSDATAVANYEIDVNTQVTGNGTINKRNISAALNVPDGGIVKTYDGTATVSSPEWKYVYSAAATTDEKKALEEIVGSDATIGITAAYKAGNGFGAKDVAYTDANSDVVTTKDIQYTLTITGTKAANYNLTAAAVDEDSDNNVLTGTIANAGAISPAELLAFVADKPTKRYDGTANVNTTTQPNAVAGALTVTTQNGEGFDISKISALYGKFNQNDEFEADPNVAYDNGAITQKEVQYTGFEEALGSNFKNYTINGKKWRASNTIYGKGIITRAGITKGDLEDAVNTTVKEPQPLLTKEYDGTTDYDVSAIANRASDYLEVHYDKLGIADNSLKYTIAKAVYDGDKNVGDNKAMTLTFRFEKNAQGNFDLVEIDNTDPEHPVETVVDFLNADKSEYYGNITAKDLTLTLNQDAVSKVYDGTNTLKANGTTVGDATIKGWFGLAQNTDIVEGDTVDIALGANAQKDNQTAYYDNKNASTSNKNIYIYSVGLTGADAGNYRLKVVDAAGTKTAGDDGKINDIQGVGTISKRTVQLSDYGNVERQYVQGNANVTTDDIAIKAGTADDWEVLKLDHIVATDTTDGLITADGITGVYLKTGNESLAEDVRRKSATDRSVEKKDVQYSGIYNVFDSTNYIVKDKSGNIIANDATAKGTWKAAEGGKITPIALEITSIIASDATKTYDGTRDFKIDGNPNAKAIDQLTFTASDGDLAKQVLTVKEAKYDSKDVNTAQHVDYTLKLSGDVNNYDLTGTVGAAIEQDGNHEQTIQGGGTITPATIYAFGYTGDDLTNDDQKAQVTKVYDRTDSAPVITGTDGRLLWVKTNLDSEGEGLAKYGTDDVSVAAAAIAYADKNAATSDTKMKYSGILLSGEDAGNYTLSNATAYGYGSITPKVLEFNTVNDKYYDANAAATENGVNPSDVNVVTAAVDAWQTAGDILSYTDAQGTHYDDVTISGLVGEYGTWNPSADGQSGTWTPNANVKRASDTDRTVQQRDVLYTGITLGGADAGNYVVKSSTKNITRGNTTLQETVYFDDAIQKGTIRPIALIYGTNVNETWTEASKVYDGTASVVGFDTNGNPITANNLTISYSKGGLTGTLDYNVVSAVYKSTTQGETDADAGPNKTVVYKVTLSPLTLNNYDLDDTVTEHFANEITSTAGGNIARRLLNVTPGTNNVKIYDGSEGLVVAGTDYTASMTDATNPNATGLVVGHDNVSVTYAANFDDKNASVDPDAAATDPGWTAKNVTYTYTLADGGDSANYTLVSNPANDAAARTTAKNTTGGIKRREVYVDFVQGKGAGLDKVYDNTSLIGENIAELIALKPVDINAKTGVVDNTVTLDTANVTANYVDKNGAASVDSDTKLGITTREVYFQNLNLTGTGKENYVVKAKNHTGQVKKTATDSTKTEQTLIGTGSIARRKIEVAVKGTLPTKEYDRTTDVLTPDRTAAYVNNGGRTLTKDDPYLKIADGVVDVSDGKLLGDEAAAYADADVTIESALYHDRNAQNGLGVTYKLKVNNQNYELVRYSIDTQGNKYIEGTGNIEKKTIAVTGGTPTVIKTYDGNKSVLNTPNLVTELFGNSVYEEDKATLLTNVVGTYDSANTNADPDKKEGNLQGVTMTFDLNDDVKASGRNYQFTAGARTGSYENESGGRIDRAALTLTPTPVTYNTGDAIPTDGYAGSVSGFKGNDALADGYNVTFERDNNRSTAAGNYTLLGYVNGQLPTQANGLMYYNNLGDGATGNYYFVQQPNNALQINAKADVMDEVNQSTIADKKFTPDDYSYNRISKDQDLTRLNRESSAAVQYAEKGVNLDGGDTKSGLSALADIQGAGSVVNLEGAFIRTSAPAEQPETVAAEAALPVPETEESDISSISLEYAGDGDNSQALLEILTNASSNAEKKGTSIVINAQDEDKEDAEEEKSRRAIFADRSNIGIETLGNAVNLNQMIG